VHLEGHQVFEAFKALFGVHGDHGLEDAVGRHENQRLVYAVGAGLGCGN